MSSCPIGGPVEQHKTTHVGVLLSVLYGHQMASLAQTVLLGTLLGESVPREDHCLSLIIFHYSYYLYVMLNKCFVLDYVFFEKR